MILKFQPRSQTFIEFRRNRKPLSAKHRKAISRALKGKKKTIGSLAAMTGLLAVGAASDNSRQAVKRAYNQQVGYVAKRTLDVLDGKKILVRQYQDKDRWGDITKIPGSTDIPTVTSFPTLDRIGKNAAKKGLIIGTGLGLGLSGAFLAAGYNKEKSDRSLKNYKRMRPVRGTVLKIRGEKKWRR